MIHPDEMIAYLPIDGAHVKLTEHFVKPAMPFTMGWSYYYSWTISLPAELSAAATLVRLWPGDRLDPLWIVTCFLSVLVTNLLGSSESAA